MLFPVKYTLTEDHLDDHSANNKDHEDVNDETKPKNKYLAITFWCMAAGQLAICFLSDNCRVFLLDRALDQGIPKSKALFVYFIMGHFRSSFPIIRSTACTK